MIEANGPPRGVFFTPHVAQAIKEPDAVFIALDTPTRRSDAHADLSYVRDAAEKIAGLIEDFTVVVTKSTVPVGTGDEVEAIFKKAPRRPHLRWSPIPSSCARARRLRILSVPIPWGGHRRRADPGGDARPLPAAEPPRNADRLHRPPGQRGRQLLSQGHRHPGAHGSAVWRATRRIETTVKVNTSRKKATAKTVAEAIGSTDLAGKRIGVLGATFKLNTDDMRDAPSLDILPALQAMGAKVRPEGAREAVHVLDGVGFKVSAYEAAEGAHALVILTEWDQFRALDLASLKLLMEATVVVDLRHVCKPAEMVRYGFTYASIGRH